ncbi:MAG TPA: VWA domain-containing protein [Chloroflexota bacterium]
MLNFSALARAACAAVLSMAVASVASPMVAAQEQSPQINLNVVVDGQPVTAESLPTADAYYQTLLARYGKEYHTCFAAPAPAPGTCPKPASMGSLDLKEHVNIELMLDASGSMGEVIDGQSKFEIAKQALSQFIETLPATANVALRVYGHKGSNADADKPVSCASSELVYPLQQLDKPTFQHAINGFQPAGWTPLAASLSAARDDFSTFDPSTSSNFVYVVSDGIETCDADPVASARELHAASVQPIVNVVGFDVNDQATQQLRAAAEAGGGQFYAASDASELDQLFKDTFDWEAWTAYYNCRYEVATTQYNHIYEAQTDSYNCTYSFAVDEMNGIYEEATRRYNEIYAAGNDAYNALYAASGGDTSHLILAAQERDDLFLHAGQIRDFAIDQANQRQAIILNAASAQTSAAIKQADDERNRAIEENDREQHQRPAP